jgi:hypothetical protein
MVILVIVLALALGMMLYDAEASLRDYRNSDPRQKKKKK